MNLIFHEIDKSPDFRQKMDINSNHFTVHLRRALHHLYEPDQLRQSPLAEFLSVAARVDASSALQKILLEAVEEIRPDDEEPSQSQAWMMYDVLYFRYVRGYSREAVANQLGISDRQLSREQRTAIEILAQQLWKTYQFDPSQVQFQMDLKESAKDLESDPGKAAWVEAMPSEQPAPWKLTLLSVMDLLHPLIDENNVKARYEPEEDLPDLLVPPVTLRHSLLTILGWVIPLARHAEVTLTPTVVDQSLVLTIQISGPRFPNQSLDPGLEVARQLIERIGGSIAQANGPHLAEVKLTFPALARIPVLVIEDNADTIQLFQRYAQGSRYSIIGSQEPTEALRLVEKINPRILLIDVMMPQLDGWDLLTQLRMNGLVQNTIILICSILPQEGLARSLGADGFIQKPVLPQDFLKALDRQMDQHSQESKLK